MSLRHRFQAFRYNKKKKKWRADRGELTPSYRVMNETVASPRSRARGVIKLLKLQTAAIPPVTGMFQKVRPDRNTATEKMTSSSRARSLSPLQPRFTHLPPPTH